jgi:transposase
MAAANRLEARFSRKHAHTWVGYKVHLSEICDESQPHLITQSDRRRGSYCDQYIL